MKKLTVKLIEIVERREKAIKVILEGGNNPVWLPLFRVKLDETAGEVTAAATLIEEKLAEASRDIAAEKAAKAEKDEELLALAAPAWESERAIGIDTFLRCIHTHKATRERVFFPKSQVNNGCAPRWLVKAKLDELRQKVAAASRNTTLQVERLLADDTMFVTL